MASGIEPRASETTRVLKALFALLMKVEHDTLPKLSLVAIALAAIFSLGSVSEPKHHVEPRYRVIELPFRPVAITDSEMITGTYRSEGGIHVAVTWAAKQGMNYLRVGNRFACTEALGINMARQVVGYAWTPGEASETAFVYSGGQMRFLESG